MADIILSREEYRDRVYACWLGKNIGSTLGAPFEGRKYVNDLTFYEPVPTEPSANDDLDLKLVWLCMLEERGIDPSGRAVVHVERGKTETRTVLVDADTGRITVQ